MAARAAYIAAASNRASNVSDCRLEDGLVAFGTGPFVALWHSSDPASRGIHATLPGHTGQVTTVKFVPARDDAKCEYFISGDSAGVTRVWKEDNQGQWSLYAILAGHSHSISALAAITLPQKADEGPEAAFVVLTGGSDGIVQCWSIAPTGPTLLQKIDLKGKIPLDLCLTYLPASESIVLAIGATETRISIFSTSTTEPIKFIKSLSLEGHTDWVRCLTFITPIPLSSPSSSTTVTSPTSSSSYDIAPGEVLLASGSQDNYIRLWRFARISSESDLSNASSAPKASGLDALDELERTLAEVGGEEGELRVKAHDFPVSGDGVFACSSEAVLLGHDAWVTNLHWAPLPRPSSPSSSSTTPLDLQLQLLSSSADRSLILWSPSPDPSSLSKSASIWTSTRRFGEFSSATNLGFFGALWGPHAKTVLAHGWGGSWHVWRESEEEGGGEWDSVVPVSGHFGTVKSVDWEPEGEYFLSAGTDMTTRLHGTWRRPSRVPSTPESWHELGRPQIHGYPLASVAFTNRLQFVSGADEKIVRVFDAPRNFVKTLKTLSLLDLGDEESRPIAANVPPLGLSNRAIASPEEAEADALAPQSNDPFVIPNVVNLTVESHPPLEEQLLGSTLWPEIEKLYGHGYEIIVVDAAHRAPLIATACKATTPDHAIIRLYNTETWKPVGVPLVGHALTITCVRFSADDRWILSASRDRTWRLFEKVDGVYQASASSKSHARIIWDACWAKDDSFFITASRDKTAKVWTLGQDSQWECAATLKFPEAATAVAATTILNPTRHLVAVGLENGHIHLFAAPLAEPAKLEPYLLIDSSVAHVLTVTSMSFSSKLSSAGKIQLATGSEDRSLRMIDIDVV